MLKDIRNIIFDLGGVVINIDYSATERAYKKLGLNDFNVLYTQQQQTRLFDLFEIGKIGQDEFFSEIEKHLPPSVTREQNKAAWHAMLLDFPPAHLKLLQNLKSHYNTYLLSNTNESHITYYNNKIKDWYGLDSFLPLFDEVYYSHEVKMRKPDPEVFEYILKENDLIPDETLFIDDSYQHIEGANTLGIRTHHLKKPQKITDIFPNGSTK